MGKEKQKTRRSFLEEIVIGGMIAGGVGLTYTVIKEQSATEKRKAETSVEATPNTSNVASSEAESILKENPIGIDISVYPQNFGIPGEPSACLHYRILPEYQADFLKDYSKIEVILADLEKEPLAGFIDLNAKTREPYIRDTLTFRYGKVELPTTTKIEVHGTDKKSREKKLIYQGTLDLSKNKQW